jgi:integrase/recombinase XerD
MKKLKMARSVTLTFEEGCNKYLENCRQRNLREGTIGHYKQSYTQFFKYFDPKMPIEDIGEQIPRLAYKRGLQPRSASIIRRR